MVMGKWIYDIPKGRWSLLFKLRKEWVVFNKDVNNYQDIKRGDMGYKLGIDSFLYQICKICKNDERVLVMPDTFVSLNGCELVQPLIKAVEEYIKSRNRMRRKHHLEKCISGLKCTQTKLNKFPVASQSIKEALDLVEYYKPNISWGEYGEGEKYFIRQLGNAILEILGS